MEIRRPKIDEAEELNSLMLNTIKNINSKDHDNFQLEGWIANNSVERFRQKISDQNRQSFVLVDKNSIVGYLAIFLESKSIGSLYVKHDSVGKGYGKKLLQYAETLAKQYGLKELNLDSSTTAFDFYKSQGYIPLEKSFHTENNGAKIPVIKMRKEL